MPVDSSFFLIPNPFGLTSLSTEMPEIASTTHSLTFLQLPSEIRLKIYSFIFHDPNVWTELFDETHSSTGELQPRLCGGLYPSSGSAILLCSRQCYDEAKPLFYERLALGSQFNPVILEFLMYDLRTNKHRIKHISMKFSREGPSKSRHPLAHRAAKP
jgi:hypothetical protein